MSYTAPPVTGPNVYAMLTECAQPRFALEWRRTLVQVTRSFDLDVLHELIRDWWVYAGGDVAAAHADRERRRQLQYARAICGPLQPRTRRRGPEIFAALPQHDRVPFEARWHDLAASAARTFDLAGFETLLAMYWLRTSDPEDMADLEADIAAARRASAPAVAQ